jgi:aminoglycoside phosphotransferase (APT) family kinase protein
MAEPPATVRRAARALGLDPSRLRPLGGASGATWSADTGVLRVGRRDRMLTELAAAAAAATVLPVPAVLDRAEVDGDLAILMERLPGRPVADVVSQDPGVARAAGAACAAVHRTLAAAAAPPGVAPVRDAPVNLAPGTEPRLLHLDLHPFNLLAGDDGALTGVVDWANAAAGHPDLDRARTWATLTLDPAALARRAEPGFADLTEAWITGGQLDRTPAAARAWACRYMLDDLAHRYPPAALAHICAAYERLRHRTAST